ncbi:E3 ubiquitin-protein ligase PDZRN3-B isoform X2 [Puntigrus tetrazona]|uniref:E3 ubiquitin-protein ligase PDZRN3-B isoform X2 n=1 Tax=Puntigrus tetrazona TaxID=1606681 RepID=UPI001C8ADCC8|nr:E3 ubiquitin-protein ligase PDZRN3-B isoform X2 [Puntigrus tetrazona]
MGFDLDRFEGPVDPDLICKLCGKVLEDPLSTPCGHVFCAACALQWLSKVSSCPVQCQKISTKDLNRVLPLKNLILKLDIKCDHRERGCDRVMKLQHLPEHAETCEFSPVRCGNEGCDAVLSLKDVASHMRDGCERRALEVCRDGCGLALTLEERSGGHSCLQALKAHSGLLQTKALSLEKELKRQSLSFGKRERSLLSKLSALHCELHITALTFQKKITEYKSRIDALSNSWVPLDKGEETRSLKVTLRRTSSGSLGFSIIGGRLCGEAEQQGDFSDGIYVSKIVENGAADKAGLHVHDRIIEDVGWLEEDRNILVDDLHMGKLKEQHHKVKEFTTSMLQQSTNEEDGGTTDTATLLSNQHEKDSGVGRTDESTRNDESSEQDILGDDQNSLCETLPENHKKYNYNHDTVESGDMHLSNDSFLSADNGDSGNFLGIPGTACERFRKLLELKSLVNGNSLQGFLEHDATLYGKGFNVDCDDQEIQRLNEELLNIELECLSIIQAHRLQAEGSDQQAKKPSAKHFFEQVHQDLINNQVDNEGFTSAYNTGESSWSLHPTLEPDSLESQRIVAGDKGKGSPMHRRNSTTTCSKHNLSPIQEISPTKSLPGDPEVTNQGKRKQSKKKNPRKGLLTSLRHSSYKNTYIPAHAQHYQSYMQLIQQKSAVEYAQSQVSLASLCKNTETTSTESRPKTGWKVKIRSDGTRYITKRPIRDQLLKERALRIREERCSATTDDDAASELKLGRYWNREERKQHAAQAKEQRQRRELIKQCCTESKEQAAALDDKKEPDIIQLSRKKMMKRRNKRIFDNWMTIQELLTHGTMSTDGTRLYNSFLSVTTV